MFDFTKFRDVPATFPAEGFDCGLDGVKALFYSGAEHKGKETRVFAWYGVPASASKESPVPGIVLLHGGGGTADASWVKMWNDRGFAAIAPDMFMGVPPKDGKAPFYHDGQSPRHEFSGPGHNGQFATSEEPPEEQWAYHMLAAVSSAFSLLASMEGVAGDKIGLTGISWGGFATCLAASFDDRFRFAVPVYGCGGYDRMPITRLQNISAKLIRKWCSLWDPANYLVNAKMPMLWINGPNDPWFSIDCWNHSADLAPNSYRSLRNGLIHCHGCGKNPPEILPFAKAVLSGKPYPRFKHVIYKEDTEQLGVKFLSDMKFKNALLVATRAHDPNCWNDCLFRDYAAVLNNENHTIHADLPQDWSAAYFVLIDAEGCFYSSEVYFNENL